MALRVCRPPVSAPRPPILKLLLRTYDDAVSILRLSVAAETVRAGGKVIDVRRYMITEAGRRAIKGASIGREAR